MQRYQLRLVPLEDGALRVALMSDPDGELVRYADLQQGSAIAHSAERKLRPALEKALERINVLEHQLALRSGHPLEDGDTRPTEQELLTILQDDAYATHNGRVVAVLKRCGLVRP